MGESHMTDPTAPYQPASMPTMRLENVGRGVLFALLAVPVGVILWCVIWSIGFVASIVGFVVAAGAVWLYRKGSGGVISRSGAWSVTAIVVVTMLIAFWAGMVVDFAGGLKGLSLIADPGFFPAFNTIFAEEFKADLPYFGLALLFTAFGAFRTLRHAFATSRVSPTTQLFGAAPADTAAPTVAPTVAPAVAPVAPVAPEEGKPTIH